MIARSYVAALSAHFVIAQALDTCASKLVPSSDFIEPDDHVYLLAKPDGSMLIRRSSGQERIEAKDTAGIHEKVLVEKNVVELNSSLWRYGNGTPACIAAAFVGLPRTLARTKVVKAWFDMLISQLQPCVDTYFCFGFGEKGNANGTPVQSWKELNVALAKLRPLVAVEVGGQFGNKKIACGKHIAAVERLAGSSYDWTIMTRPDILLIRPFPLAALNQPKPYTFRYMDFIWVSPRYDPLVQPIEASIGLEARICREDPFEARYREALDELWQNILPLWSSAPSWLSWLEMFPPRTQPRQVLLRNEREEQELVYRAVSVYCFRLQSDACNFGAHTTSTCSGKDRFNTLFSSLAHALKNRTARDILLADFWSTAQNELSQSSKEMTALHCSCDDWMRNAAKMLPATESCGLHGYYDHHSLECNDSTDSNIARTQRINFATGATFRLQRALDDATLSSVGLYAELSVFCDVYRQHDFLGISDVVPLASTIRNLKKRADLFSESSIGFESALIHAADVRDDRLESISNGDMYNQMCNHMRLTDAFRFVVDLDPVEHYISDIGMPV